MSLLSAISASRSTLGGFAVIGLCWGAVAASMPALKAQIGASDALFGSLLLASAAGLVSALWLAPWADRGLGRYGLPLGVLAMAAVFPLIGLATGPVGFALALAGLGVTSGLTDVLVNARVSEQEARHRRPLMPLNHATFSFAYAVSALIAGAGREAGLDLVVVLALPMILSVPLAATVFAQPGPGMASGGAARGGVPSVVWVCGLVVLVGFSAESSLETWSALHVERTLGGRAAEGALGPALLGLTMGIGRLGGQFLADRFRTGVVVLIAAALGAAGALIAAGAPRPSVAYVGFAIAGLGISVIGPLGLALAGRLVPEDVRTTAIARATVIGFSGFFVAPPVIGVVAETLGLRAAFVAVALLLGLSWPLIIGLRRMAPGS